MWIENHLCTSFWKSICWIWHFWTGQKWSRSIAQLDSGWVVACQEISLSVVPRYHVDCMMWTVFWFCELEHVLNLLELIQDFIFELFFKSGFFSSGIDFIFQAGKGISSPNKPWIFELNNFETEAFWILLVWATDDFFFQPEQTLKYFWAELGRRGRDIFHALIFHAMSNEPKSYWCSGI